ncbi:MAG: diguanylate cyclase [Sulfurospirillaceae bacterium]|nr:diguanylate cyclase [Sulfurospirillaceae bacterium]MDD2826837.1 diguanylate cyclase [Sulfurospirillaceae bacterium]
MVRFNKEKGKTGVYSIDVKDEIETPIQEPISIPQPSNSELEKFSAFVLKVLGDENIPPTPSNFQIYFDKLLENKPAPFKKRINEFLELEVTNNDENHARIEKEVKEGFAQIKNIMQVISTIYKNLNVMQEIVKKRSSELQINPNQLAVQNIIASLGDDLKKMFTLTSKQIELLKDYYQKTTSILHEVENNSIFDARFGVYNKRYLLKSITDELKLIANYSHASSLVLAKVKEHSLEQIINKKDKETVIRNVAKLLLKTSRRSDVVAHFGDGIFGMVLKHTDLSSAKKACDRISDLVYATSFFVGTSEIETDIELAIIALDADHSIEEFLALPLEALSKTGKKLMPYIVCTIEDNQNEEDQ